MLCQSCTWRRARRGLPACLKPPLILSLCCRLLNNAFEELVAFQRALKDFVASVDATYAKQYEDFYIGLEGSFGSKHVSPRTLTACFLSCIVCVEGIVTKCEPGDLSGCRWCSCAG